MLTTSPKVCKSTPNKEFQHTEEFREIAEVYYPPITKAETELRRYCPLLEWSNVWKNLRKQGPNMIGG